MRKLFIFAFLSILGHFAQGQPISSLDQKEIIEVSRVVTEEYGALLGAIADIQMPEGDRNLAIEAAVDPQNPQRIFYSQNAQVERDLTRSDFLQGSGGYFPAIRYLKTFNLIYKKSQTPTVELRILRITPVQAVDFIGNQVIFEITLSGENANGERLGTSRRIAQTRAEKGSNGNWNVYLSSILFFNENLVNYTDGEAMIRDNPLFRDSDEDGTIDNEDDCPNQPGPAATGGCPDGDGDGIRDDQDLCPDKRGTDRGRGCPDSDNDGLYDYEDACPFNPGPEEFDGCPDEDGDGLPNNRDNCPTQAGEPRYNGCPDTDRDGIPDDQDECPLAAGDQRFNGCPDSDGDLVPDIRDTCPRRYGLARFGGCPDTDGDQVPDNQDLCGTVPGLPEYQGCPEPDDDGDGVGNSRDACPNKKGAKEPDGCPPDRHRFINNAYLAFNYNLIRRSGNYFSDNNFDSYLSAIETKFNRDFSGDFPVGEFGISFYAPIGAYFFGYNETSDALVPQQSYNYIEIRDLQDELSAQGIAFNELTYGSLRHSALTFHTGLYFNPLYKMKFFRRLFFMGGVTRVKGKYWEEYTGDLSAYAPPNNGFNNYAFDVTEFDAWDYEVGFAIVYPVLNLEFTYYNFYNLFSAKAGVNLPFSLFTEKKKSTPLNVY